MTKIRPLSDAIGEFVRPGDHIHIGFAGTRPNAALRALAAAYAGRDPGFTISSTSLGAAQLGLFLLDLDLARIVVAGYVGHQYPAPRPSTIAARAFADGRVQFEGWSLLTLLERLRAGAHGLQWSPTRSLTGGSLPLIRDKTRRVVVDGEELTLVPPMRPDVTLVHGIVADSDGNTVLAPPYVEAANGALAAKRGAIVTVERIVSRREFRKFAHLPSIPANRVLAVSEARLGAHPGGLYADAVDAALSYSDDYEFITETVRVLEMPDASLRLEWMKEWILGDAADPVRYEAKLSNERIEHVRGWWRTLPDRSQTIARPASATERMIVTAARKIRAEFERQRRGFLFAGIGTSSLAAWLAHSTSEKSPPLVSEVGFYDYVPSIGDPWLFSFLNVPRTQLLTDTDMVLGTLLQGHGSEGMAVLATAQIDRNGDLNTSYSRGRFLTGSGGANDVASTVGDLTVVVPHLPHRLTEKVEHVTSPGRCVRRIVTDLAVLERAPDGSFEVTGIASAPDPKANLARVRAATPWLPARGSLEEIADPTPEELGIVRGFDPRRHFLGPFAATDGA